MVEVIETYKADGVHAVVVGGKREVKIEPVPAKVIPGHYTNSIKMSRPNYWTADTRLPAGFEVIVGDYFTRTPHYERAVELAVYHAKRA